MTGPSWVSWHRIPFPFLFSFSALSHPILTTAFCICFILWVPIIIFSPKALSLYVIWRQVMDHLCFCSETSVPSSHPAAPIRAWESRAVVWRCPSSPSGDSFSWVVYNASYSCTSFWWSSCSSSFLRKRSLGNKSFKSCACPKCLWSVLPRLSIWLETELEIGRHFSHNFEGIIPWRYSSPRCWWETSSPLITDPCMWLCSSASQADRITSLFLTFWPFKVNHPGVGLLSFFSLVLCGSFQTADLWPQYWKCFFH